MFSSKKSKKNELQNLKNRAKNTKEKLENIECRSGCQVCSSIYLEYINKKRATMGLVELSKHLQNKFEINLSKDVLWRHFKNQRKKMLIATSEQMLKEFDMKKEKIYKHQKSVLFLMDVTFKQILKQLDSGSLQLGVDDYEKLTKLYYQNLRDPDSSNTDDMVAVFQKAANKHGFSLNQGVLFSKSKKKN